MSDVIVLIKADDPERKPQLYACAKCGGTHSPRIYLASAERAHQAARQAAKDCYACKTHSICRDCGAACHKSRLICENCQYLKNLAAAAEVPDEGGPYCIFDGDTYFTEMQDVIDSGLEWVSPCHVTTPEIDGDNILENLTDAMYENADVDDLYGVDEFLAAVKAFNAAQKSRTWWGDNKRKIRVPDAPQGTSQ